MSGSNGRGMSGSNGRGMSGSNGRGMSGSNGRGMSGSNGRAASASSPSTFGAGYETAAMGPIDAIVSDSAVATLTVQGQAFRIPAISASAFSVGDYVVAGLTTKGAMAVIYPVGLTYIPGVSTVRVKGSVTTVDSSTGSFGMGPLSVDYTAQLAATPTLAIAVGDVVEIVGLQPNHGGVLLVDSADGSIALAADVANVEALANRQ
jgi:hypothetical protein